MGSPNAEAKYRLRMDKEEFKAKIGLIFTSPDKINAETDRLKRKWKRHFLRGNISEETFSEAVNFFENASREGQRACT